MEERLKYEIHFAPIQGVTDSIYRILHHRHFSPVDMYYTPFVRVEHGQEFRTKDLRDIDQGQNVRIQLTPQVLGGTPDELRVLLQLLLERGYHRANINLGCAFPMIARKEKGAGLLPYPEKVQALMEVVRAFPEIVCSVKMRLGWKHEQECLNLVVVLNEAPLSAVIVHARTEVQGYDGEVNWEAFRRFYEKCTRPLFFNGDIRTVDDMNQLFEEFPRLTGVMIGRGLLANPALVLEFLGKEFSEEERKILFRRFHDDLLTANAEYLQGDLQLLMKMKTFWRYFLPGTDRKLLKKIKKATKFSTYNETVAEIFR